MYLQLGLQKPTKTSMVLYNTLDVRGQFMTTLRRENSSLWTVFVIRGLKNSLLGLPAIVGLQLIQRASSDQVGDNIQKQFPKVFLGLETLGEIKGSCTLLDLRTKKTMVYQKETTAEQNLQLQGDGSKQWPIVLEQVKGTKPQQRRLIYTKSALVLGTKCKSNAFYACSVMTSSL